MATDNAADDLREEGIEPAQETDEPSQQSAEDAAPESGQDQETAPDPAPEPKRKDRTQQRIDQMTARLRGLERRTARAEAEAEMLRANQAKPDEPVPEPPPRPQLKDFNGDAAAYADALGEWTDKRLEFSEKQREAERRKAERDAEQQQKQRQLTERQEQQLSMLQKGQDEYDDYEDVVFDPLLKVSEAMLDIATDMENGHDVLYQLGKNPKEAARISQLDAKAAGVAMGQFAASMTKPGKSGTRSSSAPEPPTPAKGSGDKPDRGDLRDDLSTEEWARRFRNRRAKQRQGG